ncbi:MAG: cyanophycinase [Solirubrobacteraceae bacterium]|jgi:cyanophycinase|nr:cyanophycinase [Solirubrobacteraceae bacterium]
MPARVFLIGGGRDPEGVAASHAPFAAAVDGPVLCIVLDDPEQPPDLDRWTTNLVSAGVTDVRPLPVSAARPAAAADLAGAGGVYVAGGWTPGYQEAVCSHEFATALRDSGLPYAGFSAGAAIAPGLALVGGWRFEAVAVCDEDAGEGLDELDVRPGLGLVPFAVDVHATQWGTLTRLAHAVAGGLVPGGVAVDEHTCVEVRGGELTLHGSGSAYRVGLGTLHVLRP